MQQTINLKLNKPDYNDTADIGVINSNMDIIDEKITALQSGSGVKIYTTTELSDPQEGKIYNVKITKNTSTINEKPVYKENTSESVTLKAGKVATVYYQGGNFFYKASASGNAVAENVLAGKKFSNGDDTDITGTMPNHGAKIFKPSTANIIIPKGFYDGAGYIEGDSDLVASNIVQGKQIFGVDGNAEIITPSQKTRIANAITSKGVATSTTDSLVKIEKNIRKISTQIPKGSVSSGIWISADSTGFYYHFKQGQLVVILFAEISDAYKVLDPESYMSGGYWGVVRGELPITSSRTEILEAGRKFYLYYIPSNGSYRIMPKTGYPWGNQIWFHILNN